jgi:hypothetical protein
MGEATGWGKLIQHKQSEVPALPVPAFLVLSLPGFSSLVPIDLAPSPEQPGRDGGRDTCLFPIWPGLGGEH